MPFVIPEDLPAPLLPVAWLIGRWEGAGVVDYPTIELQRFRQVVQFRHDGRPFLEYTSHTWALEDDDDSEGRPLASECGYLRVLPSPEEAPRTVDVELLLAHPTGFVEVYVGTAGEGKLELATDAVARTASAKEYTAGTRMYGHVRGDLLWVLDMAAMGQPLLSHASAQLSRMDDLDALDERSGDDGADPDRKDEA